MKRLLSLTVVAAVALPSSSGAAWAQDKPAAPAPPKAPDKPKPDFPPFEEVMKDFAEVPSRSGDGCYFTLFHNKKTDELRAVIPQSLIGPQFLVATSMSGGPFATGFQLDHFLAYFERMDKKLVMMRVDARFEEAKGQTVADVVKRSYRDQILTTIPILTTRGVDPVVSLDGLLKGNLPGMGGMFGSVNAGLSKWASFKAFPNNVELTVELAFMSRGSGQRYPVHFSFSAVPKSDYKPRQADPRVGYFMTVRKDWGKKHSDKTLFDRYINRWNLQKRDPSLEKSPPREPIVWYIEKTVPVQFRHAVRQGILEWNRAFEKCGFLDAMVVLQQEENQYANLDPEDTRYNFFRWIVTGRAFAMGPSRDHPLTGEIFDADIVFDDSMLRHYVTEHERLTGAPDTMDFNHPLMQTFFKNNPQWQFQTTWQRLLPNVQVSQDVDADFYARLTQHMCDRGRPLCDYAAGMAHQVSLAASTFAAEGKGELPMEFLNQIVKEIVSHEVGHCLGLRHNFKASTWLDLEQIVNSDGDGVANIGSVMDYNPPILPLRGQTVNSFTTRSIGPYDYWAIEYGYRPVGAPYKSEDEMLAAITARSAEDGLDYATDEDTMAPLSPDPLTNRYDCGKDPVAYAKRQIELTSQLLKDVSEWAVKDGESYTRLRRTFTRLAADRGRVCGYVARFVGGQIMNRDAKSKDGRVPIQPVSAQKQREAVKFLVDNLFAKGLFDYDANVLNRLAPGRMGHWESDDYDFRQEFNVHDFVSGMQFGSLFAIMNPFTINRVHDNQVKMGGGEPVYTLAEHMTTVTGAIWSELDEAPRGTDEKPYIDNFRRNLQRMHLDMMLNFVLEKPGTTVPADCNAIARMQLSELSGKIGKNVENEQVDTASRAHLQDVKMQIDRALEAQFTVGRGFGGGGGMFFFHEPQAGQNDKVTVLPTR